MSEADIQHNLLVLCEAARQMLHDGYYSAAALLTSMLKLAADQEEPLFREAATLAALDFFRDFISSLPKEDFLCEPA